MIMSCCQLHHSFTQVSAKNIMVLLCQLHTCIVLHNYPSSTLPLGHREWMEWIGKEHFCFFQTAETGKRTPHSSVKGSGANHYPGAPAQVTSNAGVFFENIVFHLEAVNMVNTNNDVLSKKVINNKVAFM